MEFELGDIIHGTIDYRGKTPKRFDSGIPVLSAANVKKGKIKIDNKFVSQEYYDKWTTRGYIKPGDILITTEAPVGEIAKVPDDQVYLISRRVFALQINEKLADETYIYYLLLTEGVLKYFESICHGATAPRIYKDDILKLKFDLPVLPLQNKIASILSAYDDLIENNNQRIKLLENMAEEIYKEWFVRFRFPSYKEATFLDKEGIQVTHGTKGAIPEGWENIRINDILETIEKGPSLNYEVDEKDGTPVLNQSCVRNGLLELQRILIAKKLPKNKQHCYLRKNDILINSMGDGTLGRVSKNVQLESNNYIIHNCITFLRAKESFSQFLLFPIIKQNIPYFLAVAQGSTGQSTLKKELVAKVKTLKPTNDLLLKFDEIIEPMWNEIGALSNKNQILQETRDLLLPRLISGKLSVEDLEM
jgi:type I restriction enzyme S subunit